MRVSIEEILRYIILITHISETVLTVTLIIRTENNKESKKMETIFEAALMQIILFEQYEGVVK